MLSAVCAFALVITSCGSDDDGGGNCRECEIIGIATSICDNGDGTVTVTALGQSGTETLPEGTTFEAFADATCNAGITIGQ